MRQLYLAATGQNRGKTRPRSGSWTGSCAGASCRVHEAGRPADGDRRRRAGRRGRRPHAETFGLPGRIRDEPGPHPAGLHEGVHRGQGGGGSRREDPRRPTRVRGPRRAAHRGDRPRRGRGGHRAVERGRRDARGAGHHRQRGRCRPADRRDRAQRRAFREHGVPGRRRDREQGRVEAQPGIEQVLERGLAPYDIPLLGILPVRPILSNPTLEMILEGVNGEALHPGPDLERVIDGVAIGAMEPGHMLERVGPGPWSSCLATGRT